MIIKPCFMHYEGCYFIGGEVELPEFYGVYTEENPKSPWGWIAAFKKLTDAEIFISNDPAIQPCAEDY